MIPIRWGKSNAMVKSIICVCVFAICSFIKVAQKHHHAKRSVSLFRPAEMFAGQKKATTGAARKRPRPSAAVAPTAVADERNKIVFTNPSEEYYARHRSIQKADDPAAVEEIVHVGGNAFAAAAQRLPKNAAANKERADSDQLEYDEYGFDESVNNSAQEITGEQDDQSSTTADMDEADYEYERRSSAEEVSSSGDYITDSHDADASTNIDTIDYLPAFTKQRHDHWKRTILDEMQTAMAECCESCRTTTLGNLGRRLHAIQQQIAHELHHQYAHITADLRASMRSEQDRYLETTTTPRPEQHHRHNHHHASHSHKSNRQHHQHHAQHNANNATSRGECRNSNNNNNNNIVQVQLNDNLENYFKRVELQVPAAKTKRLRKKGTYNGTNRANGRPIEVVEQLSDTVKITDDTEDEVDSPPIVNSRKKMAKRPIWKPAQN